MFCTATTAVLLLAPCVLPPAVGAAVSAAGVMTVTPLQPGSAQQNTSWSFVGGRWNSSNLRPPAHFVRNGCWGWDGTQYRVPPAGSVAGWAEPPPDEIAEAGNWAFYTGRAFQTFSASFQFRMLAPWSGAAFVFGATNASSFYQLEVPNTGQQARAEHTWVTLSSVDAAGVRTALFMHGPVGGVTSQEGVIHRLEIALDDTGVLRVKLDGRPLPPYPMGQAGVRAGYTGFGTYNILGTGCRAAFTNGTISGPLVDADHAPMPFDIQAQIQPLWKNVTAACEPTNCDRLVRTQNGSILCLNEGPGMENGVGCHGYVRSSDNGSTWQWVPVTPHSYAGGGFSRVANGTGTSGSGVLESYSHDPPVMMMINVYLTHAGH